MAGRVAPTELHWQDTEVAAAAQWPDETELSDVTLPGDVCQVAQVGENFSSATYMVEVLEVLYHLAVQEVHLSVHPTVCPSVRGEVLWTFVLQKMQRTIEKVWWFLSIKVSMK